MAELELQRALGQIQDELRQKRRLLEDISALGKTDQATASSQATLEGGVKALETKYAELESQALKLQRLSA